jgi:hypothetical protein
MTSQLNRVFLIAIALGSGGVSFAEAPATAALGAHVHGSAQLSIALEKNNKVEFELELPGDTAVGFEKAPESDSEIVKAQRIEDLFKKKFSELVQLPAESKCLWGNPKIEVLYPQKNHSEWKIQIYAVCQKDISGQSLSLDFGKHFKSLTDLDVAVIGQGFQKKVEVPNGTGSVALSK